MSNKRDIQLLEKIKKDYEEQLRNLHYNSTKYKEVKENMYDTIDKLFSLMYKETD